MQNVGRGDARALTSRDLSVPRGSLDDNKGVPSGHILDVI